MALDLLLLMLVVGGWWAGRRAGDSALFHLLMPLEDQLLLEDRLPLEARLPVEDQPPAAADDPWPSEHGLDRYVGRGLRQIDDFLADR
jgi:hypothetical protein